MHAAGEVLLSAYSSTVNSSISSEEVVEEWVETGPHSMTQWIAWQPDWRLFDFDFLLTWGGRYAPALHEGQWWRWITWGDAYLLPASCIPTSLYCTAHLSLGLPCLGTPVQVYGTDWLRDLQSHQACIQCVRACHKAAAPCSLSQ